MQITSFEGAATIMGALHRFKYDERTRTLVLEDLTVQEAQGILTTLEVGATAVVLNAPAAKQEPRAKAPPAPPSSPAPEAPTPQLSFASTSGSMPPGTVVDEAPKKNGPAKLVVDPQRMADIARGSPASKPKADKPKPTEKPKAETKPETADDSTPPKANGTARAAPSPAEPQAPEVSPDDAADESALAIIESQVPKVLMAAKSLRDVINYLIEHEHIQFGAPESKEREEGVQTLKRRCEELKAAKVPVLTRIAELDARIERLIEIMDLGEDVTP